MMTRCRNCSSVIFYPDPAKRPPLCHACKQRNEHAPNDPSEKPRKRPSKRKAK